MVVLDRREFFTRVVKYLIEGIVVSLAAYIVPTAAECRLSIESILGIGLVAATVFSVCDLLMPSVSTPVRYGVFGGYGLRLSGLSGLSRQS